MITITPTFPSTTTATGHKKAPLSERKIFSFLRSLPYNRSRGPQASPLLITHWLSAHTDKK